MRFGNFGAEWHGFSTGCLRFVRWVAHTRTQDSLLVAGQALPGGIRTRRIPTKGFGNAQYITSPSPKLFLAQSASPLAPCRRRQGRPVTEIWLEPKNPANSNRRSLELYLRNLGLRDVPI